MLPIVIIEIVVSPLQVVPQSLQCKNIILNYYQQHTRCTLYKLTCEYVQSILGAKIGDICRDKFIVVGDNYGGNLRHIDEGDCITCKGFPHAGFYDKISIFPHHISDDFTDDIINFGWRARGMKISSEDARDYHMWVWDIAYMLHAAGVKSRVVSVCGSCNDRVDWCVYAPTDDENENSSVRNIIGIDCEDHDVTLWVYTTSDDLENLL